MEPIKKIRQIDKYITRLNNQITALPSIQLGNIETACLHRFYRSRLKKHERERNQTINEINVLP